MYPDNRAASAEPGQVRSPLLDDPNRRARPEEPLQPLRPAAARDARHASRDRLLRMPAVTWEPITELAPDWEPMDSLLFAPPRAAREDDGSFLIEAHFKTTDGRDPIEGERICRLPSGVRESLDGTPRLATVTIRGGGRLRVEEHQVDAEGWVLVPRVLLDHESLSSTIGGS